MSADRRADGVMPIGMFSRASSISVRTLRDYHDIGLLVPAIIDPSSGYRYYSVDQLADAMIIVRLRAFDLPLADVHTVLRERDPHVTDRILAGHRQLMEERLEATRQIVAALHEGLSTVGTPVHIVETERIPILLVSSVVAVEAMWSYIEQQTTLLRDLAGEHLDTSAPPGALFGPELQDDDAETATVFVPLTMTPLIPRRANSIGARVDDVPATRWATLAHTGGFDTVTDTYRLVGAWVARHSKPHPTRPVCERYPGLNTTTNNPEVPIEIRWPLATEDSGRLGSDRQTGQRAIRCPDRAG